MKNSKRIVLSLLLSFVAVPVWAIGFKNPTPCEQNLQFGTIIAPVSGAATVTLAEDTLSSAGTPKLSFSGNATTTGNLLSSSSVNNPTAPQLAKCTVTGTAGDKFTVVVAPVGSSDIAYTPQPEINGNTLGTYTLSSTGEKIIYIGGTLDLATAASGTPDPLPTFTVTVTCTNDNPTC